MGLPMQSKKNGLAETSSSESADQSVLTVVSATDELFIKLL